MPRMRTSTKVLILLTLAVIAQAVYFFPRMPAVMSSHYDAVGHPNNYMTRGGTMVFTFVIQGIELFAFGVLPYLLRHIPVALINVPNKKYWFAPERKEQTFDILIDSMHWMGTIVVMFFLSMMHLVYHANLRPGQQFAAGDAFVMTGLFVLATIGWIIWLMRRMKVPTDIKV